MELGRANWLARRVYISEGSAILHTFLVAMPGLCRPCSTERWWSKEKWTRPPPQVLKSKVFEEMAFLVAQRVKNPPTFQETQETWLQSVGWEDPLEEEMASHSSILAWRIPTDRGAWRGRKVRSNWALDTGHCIHVRAGLLSEAFLFHCGSLN